MNAILSIKPRYVKQILIGKKRYEFRKNKFKKEVKEILVYATKPIGKIICKFSVGEIIIDDPKNLWENLKEFSGLKKEEFFRYFKNAERGVAIEIRDVKEFPEPIELGTIIGNSTPPQSWFYLPHKLEYPNIEHFLR